MLNFITEGAIQLILGALIGSLGIFGITWKLWGKVVKELGDVIWKIYKAVQPESPGGKTITADEITKILKEAQEVYPAVLKVIVAHRKG